MLIPATASTRRAAPRAPRTASAPQYLAPGGARVQVVTAGMLLITSGQGGLAGWPQGSESLCVGLEHIAFCREKDRLPARQAAPWPAGWGVGSAASFGPLAPFVQSPAGSSRLPLHSGSYSGAPCCSGTELGTGRLSLGAPHLPTNTGRSNSWRGGQVLASQTLGIAHRAQG